MDLQTLPKTKSNKSFMILSALGILFVVDRHCSDAVGLFVAVFPYGSFFMPMFMFISGYFWKERHLGSWGTVWTYLIGKFKKLMVPYLLWACFYGVLVLGLNRAGMNYPQPTVRNFIYSVLTDGTTFGLNGAAWFVPTLFAVTAAYTVLRKLLGRWWNDTAALIVFFALGALTVALTGMPGGIYYKALILYKTAFFIQFFQLGLYFNRHLEDWFDRLNGLGLCLGLTVMNMALQARYGGLDLGVLSVMQITTKNCLVPLVTSVTGIFFWLKISKFLEPVLGGSKLVNYISDHTFFIMMHHLLFVNLFGGVLLVCAKLGLPGLSGFNTAAFLADPWYLYHPKPWLAVGYFLFGIAGSVLACKLLDRFKKQ